MSKMKRLDIQPTIMTSNYDGTTEPTLHASATQEIQVKDLEIEGPARR
jgi:hypothetical protein